MVSLILQRWSCGKPDQPACSGLCGMDGKGKNLVWKKQSEILEGIHIKLTCKWAAGTAQAE